jgi:hypothetical protein
MLESADLARLPSDRSRKWEIPVNRFGYFLGLGPLMRWAIRSNCNLSTR